MLTIAPSLLEQLGTMNEKLTPVLNAEAARQSKEPLPTVGLDEKSFRWQLNESAMATEKLSEGIRKFAADNNKLKGVISSRLAAM